MTIDTYKKIRELTYELENDSVLKFLAEKMEEEAYARLSPTDQDYLIGEDDLAAEEELIGY